MIPKSRPRSTSAALGSSSLCRPVGVHPPGSIHAEGRALFCVRAQTCSTDAHNLFARGLKRESHLQVVEPGKTGSGWVELKAESSSRGRIANRRGFASVFPSAPTSGAPVGRNRPASHRFAGERRCVSRHVLHGSEFCGPVRSAHPTNCGRSFQAGGRFPGDLHFRDSKPV